MSWVNKTSKLSFYQIYCEGHTRGNWFAHLCYTFPQSLWTFQKCPLQGCVWKPEKKKKNKPEHPQIHPHPLQKTTPNQKQPHSAKLVKYLQEVHWNQVLPKLQLHLWDRCQREINPAQQETTAAGLMNKGGDLKKTTTQMPVGRRNWKWQFILLRWPLPLGSLMNWRFLINALVYRPPT